MRVLQVVAADRWTGAAAVALQLAESLRGAGVECNFAYRGGDNLAKRLTGRDWCHGVLRKERTLADLRAVLGGLRELARGCDVVHCHLPHDHLLVLLALGRSPVRVVRSVHHPRHLRGDPFYRWLLRRTHGVACASAALLARCRRLAVLRNVPAVVLPAAAEERFLEVGGERSGGGAFQRRWASRGTLGIPEQVVVAGSVGKLDRDRGHDLLLHAITAAPEVWALVVGHGPWEERLRRLARRLGVADRTVFAGYVEEGLADLYAAMDLFVFPAPGSQWSHRAIAEASACGLPTLSAELLGVRELVAAGSTGDLFAPGDAASLAVLLRSWADDGERQRAAGGAALAAAGANWSLQALAREAANLYRLLGALGPREPPVET